jgi:hypothetical protein
MHNIFNGELKFKKPKMAMLLQKFATNNIKSATVASLFHAAAGASLLRQVTKMKLLLGVAALLLVASVWCARCRRALPREPFLRILA